MKSSVVASFTHAINGVRLAISTERNIRVHCTAAVVLVVFFLFLGLSRLEWGLILISMGLVIAMEMVNTAIEEVSDLITLQYDSRIKKVKDISAGAVLITAIIAACVGCVICLPKLYQVIAN